MVVEKRPCSWAAEVKRVPTVTDDFGYGSRKPLTISGQFEATEELITVWIVVYRIQCGRQAVI